MAPVIAQSKQKLWPVYVLVPVTALLLYMVSESFNPRFTEHSSSALLNAFDPWTRASLFGACALVCVACIGLAMFRRLRPKVELIVDDTGVTSKLFWGPGSLGWTQITQLKSRSNWLFVHGIASDGKAKKLIVDFTGLDQKSGTILAAMEARRPDLFPGFFNDDRSDA
jgi:hypothetical protein